MKKKTDESKCLVEIWDACPYIEECEAPPSFCLKCKKVIKYEEKKDENVS